MIESLALLAFGTVISGVSWTVHKVIQHEAALEYIRATMNRVEAKLDRVIEKHL